jgi:hypothetical protein
MDYACVTRSPAVRNARGDKEDDADRKISLKVLPSGGVGHVLEAPPRRDWFNQDHLIKKPAENEPMAVTLCSDPFI